MSATEVQTGVNTNLQKQDLSQLDVTKLTPLSPEVISRQATVNIGTIGHVAHGKSTVIKAISGVQTVRFKNELERNITIKLERIPYAKALELTRSCEKLRNFIKKQQKNLKKRENFSIHQYNKGIRDNSDDKYINSKNTNSTINKLMNKKNNISYSKQKSMMDYFQISPKNKNLNEHVTLSSTIIENKSPSCSSDWSNSVILSSDHIITRELNYSDCDSVVSYKTKITNKLCSNEIFCDDILAPPLSPLSKNFKIPKISVKKNLKNKKEKIPKKKQEYIVESIQNLEELDSKAVFEVKWKNYPPTENTWEPLENLSDCNLLEPFIDKQVKKYRITIDKILNNILNEIESEDKVDFNEIEIIKKIDNEEYDNFYYSNIVDLILLALFYLAGAKRKVRERIIRNRVKDRLLVKPYLCRRIEQLEKIDEWKSKMNKEENNVEIEVENIIDFDLPPENFNYIIKNMAHIDVHVPDDPPIGCNCVDGCSFKTNCCGKMSGSTFAYYTNRRVRIKPGFPIFECNKRCSCSADCLNRTVQNGRKNHLCIFKTNNGCGWGLKTQKVIHEGEFITEYIGEIITTKEADRRGKIYDSEGRTYLFDLDYNDGDCIYSIDAAYNGNVARFINHSCNPNSQIYPVWVDCLDPNLPRLALFALRRIEAGEEITFDYLNQHGKFNNGSLAFSSTATETVATETTIGNGENEKNLTDNNCSNTTDIYTKTNIDINLLAEIKSEKENMVCRCGSSKCRKYIF